MFRKYIWRAITKNTQHDRVVITHGTETLLQTAAYLGRCFEHGVHRKIVVLTGAHKPEVFRNSDADFNVGFACGAALSLSEPGVYVAMNANVQPWHHVVRNELTGRFHRRSVDAYTARGTLRKTLSTHVADSLVRRY